MVGRSLLLTLRPGRGGHRRARRVPYRGTLSLLRQASRGRCDGLSVRDACDWWHSGSYLMETVPALFNLKHHADRKRRWCAPSTTEDNNTIAAIWARS